MRASSTERPVRCSTWAAARAGTCWRYRGAACSRSVSTSRRAAIGRARDRGAAVILGSIFDPVPSPERWRTALLLDGNIGIGGRPVALLRRLGELLSPRGEILCELDPPGTASRCELIALEDREGARSRWFAWARVSVDEVGVICSRSRFTAIETWGDEGRWFARLALAPARTGMTFGWRGDGAPA